jgi:L-fucose mutarotase
VGAVVTVVFRCYYGGCAASRRWTLFQDVRHRRDRLACLGGCGPQSCDASGIVGSCGALSGRTLPPNRDCDHPCACLGWSGNRRETYMLIGIHPLLSPDLLHALASMGHGDRIAVVDANFPAVGLAKRLVSLPGISAPAALQAILSVMPVDDFEPDPASVMQVVGDAAAIPETVRAFTDMLTRSGLAPPVGLERTAFYRAAAAAFVVVQTGELRLYGNILLTKGVVRADAPG